MNKFPVISHIDDVIDAIKDREEIVVSERPYGTVVNYLVAFTDTFPDPSTAEDEGEALRFMIRRECRGLKFNNETGNIIARPYHKFFNIGEKEETQHNNVDWSRNFSILDKLDGSMIHPVDHDGDIIYCTRMGATDVAANAQTFADDHKIIRYNEFSRDIIRMGLTPIFEWCSKKNRIVLLYTEEALVLTGIRDMETGAYMTPRKMAVLAEPYGVPVVKRWEGSFDGIQTFMDETNVLQDEEGYVFRFDNGDMMKWKNDWYVQIHRAKDQIRFEKDVIKMFLEGTMDDVLPHILPEDKVRLTAYTEDLTRGIEKSVADIHSIVYELNDSVKDVEERFQRRDIANIVNAMYRQPMKALLFKSLNNNNITQNVIEHILDKTNSSTQVDSVRSLFNIDWDDY